MNLTLPITTNKDGLLNITQLMKTRKGKVMTFKQLMAKPLLWDMLIHFYDKSNSLNPFGKTIYSDGTSTYIQPILLFRILLILNNDWTKPLCQAVGSIVTDLASDIPRVPDDKGYFYIKLFDFEFKLTLSNDDKYLLYGMTPNRLMSARTKNLLQSMDMYSSVPHLDTLLILCNESTPIMLHLSYKLLDPIGFGQFSLYDYQIANLQNLVKYYE